MHAAAGRLIRRILPVLVVLLISVLPGSAAPPEERSYSFAVVPQFPPALIQRDWTPVLARLSAASGVPLTLTFYRSIPDFEAAFLRGEPDFVYLNPYHAVMARRAQGYLPLVRDGATGLKGILVVRRDSGLRAAGDLEGKTVAFPSPNAFASSLYMRALLSRRENVSVVPKYVATHSNVYRHVLLGTASAGGGVNKTLSKEPADLREQLRVLYETPMTAPHPVAVHPRVPAEVRTAVIRAFLTLGQDGGAQGLLSAIEMAQPVRADYQKDYRPLEALGLERFAKTGEE